MKQVNQSAGNLVCGAPLWGKSCIERNVAGPCGNCRALMSLRKQDQVKAAKDLGIQR